MRGVINYRIQSQLQLFEKTDPVPVRVKPIPITLVIRALLFASQTNRTLECKMAANMMCIVFFFLLCPGEYTKMTTDDHAFALDNVALFIGTRRLHNKNSSEPELLTSMMLQSTFTTQISNNCGVIIVHARSNNVLCYPVSAATCQPLLHHSTFGLLPSVSSMFLSMVLSSLLAIIALSTSTCW